MKRSFHSLARQSMLWSLLMSLTSAVYAYEIRPEPVSILPNVARHGCTPCNKADPGCVPCDKEQYPREPRPAVKRLVINGSVPHFDPAFIVRVGNFNRIEADGNVMIVMKHSSNQQVAIYGNSENGRPKVDATVRRGVLYIKDISRDKLGKITHDPIYVEVDTPSLKSIALHEQASFAGENVNFPEMDIDSDSSAYIRLRGEITVHHITLYNRAYLDLDWINSDHLHITASGKTQIRLAGNVGMLEVTATGDSHVDGRYLRTDNAYIKTANTAEVDVSVMDHLSGFASNFSNIYYFKSPLALTRHTYQSGVVMQLYHWG